MSDHYRILSATFVDSVHQLTQLPTESVPEIAFVGRSNVGKSSLINALVNQRSLAQTSKKPGRTRALNYFEVTFRSEHMVEGERADGEKQQAFFVDLPGFGYAEVSKKEQARWKNLIQRYLLERAQLCGVVLLLDSRREPREEESWFLEADLPCPVLAVMTKVDKLSSNERSKNTQRIAKALSIAAENIMLASTLKSGSGITELRDEICGSLDNTADGEDA